MENIVTNAVRFTTKAMNECLTWLRKEGELEVSFDLSAKLRSKPRVNEITSFCDALKEL